MVLRLVIGFGILAVAAPTIAGVNAWTLTGPEGGAADAVAVHPSGAVLMTSGGTIFRSLDLGQSWTAVYASTRTSVGRIVIDPTSPNRVLVASPGNVLLYRSEDGGSSFALSSAPAAIWRFAVGSNTNTLYGAGLTATVFRSSTFGAQWENRSQGLPSTDILVDIVVDPQNAETVYVLTQSQGLYKTVNGGALWTAVNPLTGLSARKLAIDPKRSNEMLLAAVGNQGLFSSTDFGATWTSEGAPYNVAWVGYQPTDVGAAIAVPFLSPVLHRTARSQAWTPLQAVKALTISDAAFDPRDTDPTRGTLVVADDDGALVTRDGGATFVVGAQGVHTGEPGALATAPDGTVYASFYRGPIGVHRRKSWGWESVNNADLKARDFNPLQPRVLATDPHNSNTVFVASGTALLRSLDGGQTWDGPHPEFLNAFLPRDIGVDPSNSQIVYLSTSNHGVYRTDNGGITWSPPAVPTTSGVIAIAVDSRNPGTVYGAVEFPSAAPFLLKTTNGGASWAPADTGLNAQAITSVAIDPSNSQIVYAGGTGNGEGTFKSINAGQSWTRVGAPAGDDPGIAIVIDPIVPTTLYMAISANGGASRSVDGGATWEALPTSGLLRMMALDPAKPTNLIAGAASGGLMEIEIAPDLVATIPSSPAKLTFGASGSAAFRVANRGPFAATAVKMSIAVPAGITASAPTSTQGTCSQTGASFDCSLGVLRVNQPVDVTLTLLAGALPATGALTATTTAHESDAVPGNNTASAPIAVVRATDLRATLTSSDATINHNAELTLMAAASNVGPSDATNSQLTIALATGFTFQSAAPSQGSCSHASGTVTCSLGSIAPGAQANVAVKVLASGQGALTTTAGVSSAEFDPNSANDSATVIVTSRPLADVGVRIGASASQASTGQPFAYSVTVTNAGPEDLAEAMALVTLTGVSASTATSTQGTCTVDAGATVSCPLGPVPKNGTVLISVTATPNAPGNAVATAKVLHSASDPDASNDQATQQTTVNAPPTSGGGGGGGGANGLLELALLLALRVLRGSRQHRAAIAQGGTSPPNALPRLATKVTGSV